MQKLRHANLHWPEHCLCKYDSKVAQKLDLKTLKLWDFQWDSFLEDDQS